MPFLNVNAVDVPVAYNQRPTERQETLGEFRRAFTGKMLSSVRGWRSSYDNIETRRMTLADGNTLWNALVAGPIYVYGDMFGTTSASSELMYVTAKSRTFEQIGADEYVRITFSLAESD